MLSALTAGAQYIEQGSMWYNGALVYTATLHEGGKVLLGSTVEGEELEFMLVPVKGEPGTYIIAKGPNDAMMVEKEGHTVRLIQQEDLNILCFYDAEDTLYKLMSATREEDNQKLNVENWMTLLRGDYTMADGTRVTIDWNKALVGGTYVPIEAMTFKCSSSRAACAYIRWGLMSMNFRTDCLLTASLSPVPIQSTGAMTTSATHCSTAVS